MTNPLRVRAEFEAHRVDVGLSTEIPIRYNGVIEKYQLVDARASLTQMRGSLAFEFGSTTDEFNQRLDSERLACFLLVARLPDDALTEAKSELQELNSHYLEIAETRRALPAPKKPELVTARVLDGE